MDPPPSPLLVHDEEAVGKFLGPDSDLDMLCPSKGERERLVKAVEDAPGTAQGSKCFAFLELGLGDKTILQQ
jgi:hypothetical protein